jgi:chemotaxis protein methyltransferase CheR
MSADGECVGFLQWALPRMGLRWPGFRKVRRQVCRRVRARVAELGLGDFAEYRAYLDAHPEEWAALEALTPITISRFYRDREVMAGLARVVLPALAADRGTLRVWSAGCASGEEPYTIALMCAFALRPVRLEILATDISPVMLRRAREAVYSAGSLADLPAEWRSRGFAVADDQYRLRDELRAPVSVRAHDLRGPAPGGAFDLVLCRNVAFTYFAADRQAALLERLPLRAGGALVLGLHESPGLSPGLEAWPGVRAVWRKWPPRELSPRSF